MWYNDCNIEETLLICKYKIYIYHKISSNTWSTNHINHLFYHKFTSHIFLPFFVLKITHIPKNVLFFQYIKYLFFFHTTTLSLREKTFKDIFLFFWSNHGILICVIFVFCCKSIFRVSNKFPFFYLKIPEFIKLNPNINIRKITKSFFSS